MYPMKKQLLRALVVSGIALASIAGLPGCAVTSGQETTGQYFDDTVLTSEIKAKLLGNTVFSIIGLHVETLKGVVTLSGSVKNAADKAAAEKVAHDTKGVKSVTSNIIIKPVI
jgi:hyperosmotically inducible periplasmic protein